MAYPTLLEESPHVDVEKIQRMCGLVLALRRGEPPYEVNEYIRLDNDFWLLDSKRFSFIPAYEGDTTAVPVRGSSRMVSNFIGSWYVRLKHWRNIQKIHFIDFLVDLL